MIGLVSEGSSKQRKSWPFYALIASNLFLLAIVLSRHESLSSAQLPRLPSFMGGKPHLDQTERRTLATVLNNSRPQAELLPALRNDTFYITGTTRWGVTNQIFALMNLLYLAKLTNRVPILPAFTVQSAHPFASEPARFSTFYDLDYFEQQTGIRIFEWPDVKLLSDRKEEHSGCWMPQCKADVARSHTGGTWPFEEASMAYSYWPMLENSCTFESVASHIYNPPVEHLGNLLATQPSAYQGKPRPDQGQLTCISSHLYFLSSTSFNAKGEAKEYELGTMDPSVYREVGQHLRFSKLMEAEVDRLLAYYGIHPQREPYIVVHIRRTDFCTNLSDCSDLSKFFQAADEVRKSGCLAHGTNNVLVTSGDHSEDFIQQIRERGWRLVGADGESAEDGWIGMMADTALAARASGFVGTRKSTMSELSAVRVSSRTANACVLMV